ncbi:MAG TPA: ferrous iron transport protein A [Candidatus Cloacimonetes bacterium]|nr:ferrous iron transport protein A [Candidatus Cloacimonadota bacterium]HEX38200.1 ferrous iron transport protein A [Candidatus Cloacimonadota bacterium]
MDRISIIDLKKGEQAVIVSHHGGRVFERRMSSLGLRPNAVIKKISSQLFRGPVTVQVGNSQVALGHGMARRIYVERIGNE